MNAPRHDARSALAATAIFVAVAAAPSAAQTFGPASSWALPGQPGGLAVGDLNLDGILDVVVTQPLLDRVALLYGLPGGGFAPPTLRMTADEPVAVALGDLNGDGRLDIVVACRGSLGVTLMFGKPTGGLFTAGETWSTGAGGIGIEPSAVTLIDVDRDGALDVVAGHEAAGTVGIRFGTGAGPLGALVEYDVGGEVRNLVAASIDGDVYPEIVVAADFGGTKILRNQGGTGFVVDQGPGTFGGFTAWVDLGDADGDGDLDLLWLEDDGLDICAELAPNVGGGIFSTSQVVHVSFSTTSFRATRFGTLDTDGDLDIVSTGLGFPGPVESIEVAFGLPGLAVAQQCAEKGTGIYAAFELADLDGDGRDELLAANTFARTLDVLPNGACGTAPQIAAVSPASVPAVAAGATQVTLSGCALNAVTQVTVGGLTATTGTSSCGDELTLTLPEGLPLGPAAIVASGPAGVASASVEVAAPPAPVIKILPAGVFSISGGADLAVGAAPGDLVLVFASINNLPSVIPGLVELDLGGNFAWLYHFATVTLQLGEGVVVLPVPTANLPLDGMFWLQTAVVTAGAPTLPLPTSPVVLGVVVP